MLRSVARNLSANHIARDVNNHFSQLLSIVFPKLGCILHPEGGGDLIGTCSGDQPINIVKKDCRKHTTCHWSSGCINEWGGQTAYGTQTFSINGDCSYPTYGHGAVDEYYCSPWELTARDSYQQCYETGGGSDPGEGSGPGQPGDPNNPSTPCEHARLLGLAPQFTDAMTDLKSKVNANYEAGYVYVNPSYQYVQGQPNEPGFNLQITGQIGGMMHSHYTGLLSIYSPDDLYSFVHLYKNGNMWDPSTFSMGLVTASGTQYLLYIDDMTAFQNFADFITTQGSYDAYSIAYENLFNIRPSNSAATNEANFLNYIRAANIGLRLMKGSDNFHDWSPIKSDGNGNIVPYPCN